MPPAVVNRFQPEPRGSLPSCRLTLQLAHSSVLFKRDDRMPSRIERTYKHSKVTELPKQLSSCQTLKDKMRTLHMARAQLRSETVEF